MGTKTLISAEEYLRTSYEGPEPDFVDGEIVPRAMPNTFHSRTIRGLTLTFVRQAPLSLFGLSEIRILVGSRRYRILDFAVFESEPQESIPEVNPLIAIEVLSPDDSYAELMRKFADYAALGIPHIWLADPIAKRFSIYRDESLIAVPQFEVPEHGVSIRPSDVFDPTAAL